MSASTLPQLRSEFATTLAVASRKMHTLFDGMVRERGFSLSRVRILRHLSRHPSSTQAKLASDLDIEGSTLVRLLDGLEEQGLIERCVVEGDRRAKQISLTAAAMAQLAELETVIGRLHDVMFDGIPRSELQAALRVLGRVIGNMEHQSP